MAVFWHVKLSGPQIQLTFTCSNSTIKTEKGVKYIQSLQ